MDYRMIIMGELATVALVYWTRKGRISLLRSAMTGQVKLK